MPPCSQRFATVPFYVQYLPRTTCRYLTNVCSLVGLCDEKTKTIQSIRIEYAKGVPKTAFFYHLDLTVESIFSLQQGAEMDAKSPCAYQAWWLLVYDSLYFI